MKVNSISKIIKFKNVPCGGVIYDDMGSFLIKIKEDIQSAEGDFRINAISISGDRFCSFENEEFVNYYPNASLNLV